MLQAEAVTYDGARVDKWTDRILRMAEGADDCYIHMKHDETRENALLAQRLSEKLGRK